MHKNPEEVQSRRDAASKQYVLPHVRMEEIPPEIMAMMQPLPDLNDETSTMDWLRRVVPLMDGRDPHVRNLSRVVARHDFRQSRQRRTNAQ